LAIVPSTGAGSSTRRGALHVRMLLDARAFGQHLVRGELLARRDDRGLGRRDRALRRAQLRRHVVVFLAADRAGGEQRLAPRHVALRLDHVALQPRHVGLAQRDLRLEGGVVGVQGAHLAHRLRELRLGLLERDLRVGGVEPHQHLAGLDEVGVVGVDREHRPAHLRRDLDQVALHIGVVGRLEVLADDEVIRAITDAGQHDQHGDRRQPLLARLLAALRGRRGGEMLLFGGGVHRCGSGGFVVFEDEAMALPASAP
jgi:hypothetical protein